MGAFAAVGGKPRFSWLRLGQRPPPPVRRSPHPLRGHYNRWRGGGVTPVTDLRGKTTANNLGYYSIHLS